MPHMPYEPNIGPQSKYVRKQDLLDGMRITQTITESDRVGLHRGPQSATNPDSQQRHHQLHSPSKGQIVSFLDTDLDAVVN
jgi:hypothetical protein